MATQNKRAPERTPTRTHNYAPAVELGVFDELLFAATTTYLGEDTFYVKATDREQKLRELVRHAVVRDPHRTAQVIERVRNEFGIRTASALLAVEYVRSGAPGARAVVDSVIRRPDDALEVLAIYQARYGADRPARKRDLVDLPWSMRRGVADGLVRQLTEKNWLKYRGAQQSRLVTFGDAIELTHPKPRAPWQEKLFKFILDDKHGLWSVADATGISTVSAARGLGLLTEDERRPALRQRGASALAESGYTWEKLSAWLPGGMDAEAWHYAIPQMPVFALLRNLRNFDEARIAEADQDAVERRLTDPTEVGKSRIFPYHVWQAYKAAPSDRWKHPLAKTLSHSIENVPTFHRTLFLVDVSGSMADTVAGKSKARRYELATVMGVSALLKASASDLALFAVHSKRANVRPGISTLNLVRELTEAVEAHIEQFMPYSFRLGRYGSDPLYDLGQGTQLHEAIRAQFDPAAHDRVIVFTDDQTSDDRSLSAHVPEIVYFDLGGYNRHSDWGKRRLHVSGFSDAGFRAVHELVEGAD